MNQRLVGGCAAIGPGRKSLREPVAAAAIHAVHGKILRYNDKHSNGKKSKGNSGD